MNREFLSNMEFVATRSLLLGLFILLIGQSVLSADEEGFVSIFNGKDLSGWHIEKEAPFKVRDVNQKGSGVFFGHPFFKLVRSLAEKDSRPLGVKILSAPKRL